MSILETLFKPHIKVHEQGNEITIEGLYEKTLYSDIRKSKYAHIMMLYMNDIITRGLITHKLVLKFPTFFALEILWFFEDLIHIKKRGSYISVYNQLLENTWLTSLRREAPEIDISNISKMLKYPPREYQLEFLRRYQLSKLRLRLNGALLAFEQGLGKTYTALINSLYIGNPVVIIVCPLSLVDVWKNEIKDKLILRKYVIERVGTDKPTKTANFIISNYERVNHINDYLPENVATTLILDECHNIRYMKTIRAKKLVNFCRDRKITDIMALSGTPIKALATELIPILYLLDYKFDKTAEQIFNQIFKTHRPLAYTILRRRLTMMMHRELKELVLKELPPKIEHDLFVKVKNSEKYTIPYLKERMREYIIRRVAELNKRLKHNVKFLIHTFKDAYKNNVIDKHDYKDSVKVIKTLAEYNIWAVEPVKYKHFIEIFNTVKNWVKRTKGTKVANDLIEAKSGLNVILKATGEAIGKIYTKAKQDLVIDIIDDNLDLFMKMIDQSEKKVIFFSKYVKPVNHIAQQLTRKKYKCIAITGTTPDLSAKLKLFITSNDIPALSATISKLSTGVTLIVANTVIFLDLPYRDADFKQAEDRVHRIGQDSTVHIYKVLLDTGNTQNISMKADKILLWSREMFNELMSTQESYIINELKSLMI